MRYRKGNVLISISAFFIIFFVFCAFAIDFSLMLSARSRLQNAVETSALSAAADSSPPAMSLTADKIFSYYKTGQIKHAKITAKVPIVPPPPNPRSFFVSAQAPIPTTFLAVLGISVIEIQAKAKAQILEISLEPESVKTGVLLSSILVDKQGDEIYVEEAELAHGYYVFVGLNDGENPAKWVNISCTGTATDSGGGEFTENEFGGYYKGSAVFDMGKTCADGSYSGNAQIASNLRIIPFQGAVISSVKILNVAKLVAN